jgi:hypothetical protein
VPTKTFTRCLTPFGRNGRAWREADVEATDLETVIADLLSGQFKNPLRVIAFNTNEGWSQDVSADVARELRRRCDEQMTFSFSCKTSWIVTRGDIAACSCRCRYALRDQIDDLVLRRAVNRVWLFDDAREVFGKPLLTSRQLFVALHAPLHDGPLAIMTKKPST